MVLSLSSTVDSLFLYTTNDVTFPKQFLVCINLKRPTFTPSSIYESPEQVKLIEIYSADLHL